VASQSPPGWYQDPRGQGQRYWDGQQWTEHTHPAPAQQPPAQQAPAQQAPAQRQAAPAQAAQAQPAPAQPAPAQPAPAARPAAAAPPQARPAAPAQAPGQFAGAPVAPRPAATQVAVPPAVWVALAAVVPVIIGGFGPWYEVAGTTVNGTSENAGDGWVNIALAVIAGIFLAVWFANRRAVWPLIVAAVLGALSTITGIIDLADILSSEGSGFLAAIDPDPRWGIYLVVIFSVVLAIAATVSAATARR
jgi:Protein of unknown function (DUF2510)